MDAIFMGINIWEGLRSWSRQYCLIRGVIIATMGLLLTNHDVAMHTTHILKIGIRTLSLDPTSESRWMNCWISGSSAIGVTRMNKKSDCDNPLVDHPEKKSAVVITPASFKRSVMLNMAPMVETSPSRGTNRSGHAHH